MENLLMRRPDLGNLPSLPPLPDGYALRETEPGDIPAVAAVLDRAFTDEAWGEARSWDEARVAATLNEQEGVIQTLVIDFRGRPIATASARVQPDRFPGSSYLHWVAVDPDHRGQRLGFFLSLAVLHTFVSLGCADALLETQDERLPAIKTYLKLGFAPVYRDETHRERWAAITGKLTPGANLGLHTSILTVSVVEAYLNTLTTEQRVALERVRNIIRQIEPETEEALSYGMPAFKYKGRPLLGFTASNNHLSIHPFSPSVVNAVREKLQNYELLKGTIRFQVNKPIPEAILVEIIHARLTEILDGKPSKEKD